jgi:predicted transposase/invertase (TIGR01784 family)
LRNKDNFDILEGFLSELLMRDVSVQSIGESESNREYLNDKQNRVDILVEDVLGEIMLIELQFETELDYLHRMLFGTSKAVIERMVQGMTYKEIKKIYSINIVYFDLGQGSDYIYHGKTNFTGRHDKTDLFLSDSQRKKFGKETPGDIYPEYIILKINSFNDILEDTMDEWIYMLKNNIVKTEFKAKGLQKARAALDINNLTPDEKKEYDYMMETRSKNLSNIASAKDEGFIEGEKKGLEKGEKKGLAEGKKKGLAEGKKKGIAEGKKKGKKEGITKVAINALKKGMSPEDVSELTELTLDEINRLKNGL